MRMKAPSALWLEAELARYQPLAIIDTKLAADGIVPTHGGEALITGRHA
jgi:hypothetical protein